MNSRLRLGLWLLMGMALLQGCATVSTLDVAKQSRPLIYSGTRLDWYALNGGCCPTDRFGTSPPSYPGLDLPFSMVVDTLVLPATICAELGLGFSFNGGF